MLFSWSKNPLKTRIAQCRRARAILRIRRTDRPHLGAREQRAQLAAIRLAPLLDRQQKWKQQIDLACDHLLQLDTLLWRLFGGQFADRL